MGLMDVAKLGVKMPVAKCTVIFGCVCGRDLRDTLGWREGVVTGFTWAGEGAITTEA